MVAHQFWGLVERFESDILYHLGRCRSGYNGADLKSAVRTTPVGSNPTLPAKGDIMLKCYYCKNRMIHKDDLLKPMMAQRIACKQG